MCQWIMEQAGHLPKVKVRVYSPVSSAESHSDFAGVSNEIYRAVLQTFFHVSFLVDGHEYSSAPAFGPFCCSPYLNSWLPQQGDAFFS